MKQKNSKLQEYLKEFWKYKDLLRLMIAKNIKLKYRRSFLGYVWSILNPLLIMIVLTLVFSSMFNRQIENYPVYLFTGRLLFTFMTTSTTNAIYSITSSASLLKKTYVPKYIFTVAKVTSALIDLVFSLGALLIVLIATRSPITWHALLFPVVLFQEYVFCIGLGLFLAQANVFFRDTQFIYNAVTTAWLYLTPLFYPMESLNATLRWCIEHFNPMYFYVSQFRDLIYYGRFPQQAQVLYGCISAMSMLALGIWSFMRSKDKFILYI